MFFLVFQAFGGDPDRITIFGESSGGASVAFHLVTKQSQGLYNRAILESPGITQSKSWIDSTQNTQFVSSALTAAGKRERETEGDRETERDREREKVREGERGCESSLQVGSPFYIGQ